MKDKGRQDFLTRYDKVLELYHRKTTLSQEELKKYKSYS